MRRRWRLDQVEGLLDQVPLILAALLLTSCGPIDTHRARDPRGVLIGQFWPDLAGAMGKPDSALQTGPDTAIVEYDHRDAATGLKLSLTLLGSIELGGGGGCSVVFTVLRDGTVADVTFPRAYSDSLFGLPDDACAPLVSEALAHPSGTDRPAGYDAFVWIFGGGKR